MKQLTTFPRFSRLIPEILHTCYDARVAGLKIYKKAFFQYVRETIYFDFDRDYLELDVRTVEHFAEKSEYGNVPLLEPPKVKNLAIMSGRPIRGEDLVFYCQFFTGLERLAINEQSLSSSPSTDPLIHMQNSAPMVPHTFQPDQNSFRHNWDKLRGPIMKRVPFVRPALKEWKPPLLIIGTETQWEQHSKQMVDMVPVWGGVDPNSMDWESTVIIPSLEYVPRLETVSSRGVGLSIDTAVAMGALEPTGFPRLPIELQLIIWDHVEIEPSIITVNPFKELFEDEKSHHPAEPFFACSYRVPAIFHACHNSRQIALKSHPLLFGGGSISRPVFGSPMPFNTDKDVLLFHDSAVLSPFVLSSFQAGFDSIHHLAISISSVDTITSLTNDLFVAFSNGSNIKHIFLIREEPAAFSMEWEDESQELSNECFERNLLPGYMIKLIFMKERGSITAMEKLELTYMRNFSVVSREDFETKWRRLVQGGSLD
ncbi:hypothetical protein PZA11_005696 [Diplocarpon coronariae]